jgi:hypothetical protein
VLVPATSIVGWPSPARHRARCNLAANVVAAPPVRGFAAMKQRPRVRGADSSRELVSWLLAPDSVELGRGNPAVFRPVVAAISPGAVDDLLDEELLVDEWASTMVDDWLSSSSVLDDDDSILTAHALAKLMERGDLFPVWLVGDVARRCHRHPRYSQERPPGHQTARDRRYATPRPADCSATMVALRANRRRWSRLI